MNMANKIIPEELITLKQRKCREMHERRQTRLSGLDEGVYRQVFKPLIFYIKGKICEWCGSTKNIDTHHTDYNHQTIHTILVLCGECHAKADKLDGTRKHT
jgi:hypothetical protein